MIDQSRTMKILWAVDAFDDLPESRKKITEVLEVLSHGVKLEVHPVYLLSPWHLQITEEFEGPSTEVYELAAKKVLSQVIQDIHILGLQPSQILTHHKHSFSGSVNVLSQFAERKGFDLLLTGTHGRKGLNRMIFGSFAEALLLQSKIPVLIVGPHTQSWAKSDEKPRSILVPNDLSDSESPFFDGTFDLAEVLNKNIIFLHAITRPIEPVAQSGIYLLSGGWITIPAYLEKKELEQKAIAKEIQKRAEKRQIACDVIIDYECQSVVESILRYAREKNVALIAMMAESGPVTSALIGSITRKVIRDAPCPVWVTRKKADKINRLPS